MPDLRFMKLAVDPTLIPGVYNGCDQGCDDCPPPARCLAFKCRPHPDTRADIYHDIANAMYASMQCLKDCHEAEGLKPPEDLMRLLAGDPRKRIRYVHRRRSARANGQALRTLRRSLHCDQG